MFTNGTTVAATTAEQAMLGRMIGLPVQYGRAVVLGNVPLPDSFVEQVHEAGESVDDYTAYVIEPRNADGDPITADDVDEGVDPDDLAYLAIRREDGPLPMSPIGPLAEVILAERLSKSEFLAGASVRADADVDQFAAALASDDFDALLAELCDDEDQSDEHVD